MKRLFKESEYQYINIIQKVAKTEAAERYIVESFGNFLTEQEDIKFYTGKPLDIFKHLQNFKLDLIKNTDATVKCLNSIILNEFDSNDYERSLKIINSEKFKQTFIDELFNVFMSGWKSKN